MQGIKHWSENTPYAFIRAGVVRLGEKNEKGIPKKLDHFVVPEEVALIYGEQPRALDIVLPDEEDFISANLKRYDGNNNLICYGDGENASVSLNRLNYRPDEYNAKIEGDRVYINNKEVEVSGATEQYQWAHFKCPYHKCPHYQNSSCKETVILYFVLTKVPGCALRVYTITTRSYNSYHNLILSAQALKKRFGRCSFIPVQLRVKTEKKTVPGKQYTSQVPILYLDFEQSYEKIWEQALHGRMVWSFNSVNGISATTIPENNPEKNEEKQQYNPDSSTVDSKTYEYEDYEDSTGDRICDFRVIKNRGKGTAKDRLASAVDVVLLKTEEFVTIFGIDSNVDIVYNYKEGEIYKAKIIPGKKESSYILKQCFSEQDKSA